MTEPLRVTIGSDSNGARQVLVVAGDVAVLRLRTQDAKRLAAELVLIARQIERRSDRPGRTQAWSRARAVR